MAAQVWIVTLSAIVKRNPSDFLSPDERDRAARFQNPVDQARYIHAHAALRLLLAARLRCAPADLTFARTPNGKPVLENSPLRFNLSRSGDRVVVGIADAEIGVDTEEIVSDGDHDSVARREFSPTEIDWMNSAPESERLRRFYRLWVVREALAKAQGTGLSVPASALLLDIVDDCPQPRARLEWCAHETADGRFTTAAVLPPSASLQWNDTLWEELADPLVTNSRRERTPTARRSSRPTR